MGINLVISIINIAFVIMREPGESNCIDVLLAYTKLCEIKVIRGQPGYTL